MNSKHEIYLENVSRCLNISKKSNITVDEVINLFRFVREIDQDYVEIANSLIPEAGYYLGNSSMTRLIRADGSDEEAFREIVRQKEFFKRAAFLLPDIFSFLRINCENIFSILMLIDDVHHDFEIVSRSDRQDKEERKIFDTMHLCYSAAANLADLMDRMHYLPVSDFERNYRAVMKLKGHDLSKSCVLGTFIDQLAILQASLEISKFKLESGHDNLKLTANQSKTFVVENVYHLTYSANGPKLVTTPGSDFAVLCGLMFELVSGKSDESLSGAINRFSRSKLKRQIDDEEDDLRIENEIKDDETDNFRRENQSIKECFERIKTLKNLIGTSALSDKARNLASKLIACEEKTIQEERARYGPNIVWAHQAPPSYWERSAG